MNIAHVIRFFSVIQKFNKNSTFFYLLSIPPSRLTENPMHIEELVKGTTHGNKK